MNDFVKRLTPYLCGTAILVVITLTAVSKAELDAHLLRAANLFVWSAGVFAPRLVLDFAHSTGSRAHTPWHLASLALRILCFAGGGTLWLTGAGEILLHFRIDPFHMTLILILLVVSLWIGQRVIAAELGALSTESEALSETLSTEGKVLSKLAKLSEETVSAQRELKELSEKTVSTRHEVLSRITALLIENEELKKEVQRAKERYTDKT